MSKWGKQRSIQLRDKKIRDKKIMNIKKGKIINLSGSWGSGLGQLTIENEDGQVEMVHCENTSTVRALESCFGNIITPGHTADGEGYKGKEIYWTMDEMGLVFGGFTPVSEASDELISAYKKSKKEYDNKK